MEKKLTFLEPKIINSINNDNIEKFELSDFEISADKFMKFPNGYMSIGKKTKTNQMYLIKILKKKDLISNKVLIEHELNQFENLSSLYHPFILDLKGINFNDPYNLFYTYEYITGIPLKHLIKTESITLEKAKFYIASIITILDYIHKKRIIHRDLRPEIIYINRNGYIKLIDFTLSKKLKNDYTYSICGTHEYYSPEMINQSGYNKSIDYWQLGILFFEILFGFTPFIAKDPYKLFEKIKKGKFKFPRNFDINAQTLIKHFLIVDTKKRLGCTKRGIYEIIQNPFFEGFDWEGLLHRLTQPPFIPKVNRNSIYNYKKLDKIYIEDGNSEIPKENDPFLNLNK